MKSKVLIMALIVLAVIPLVLCGCQGKAKTPVEPGQTEDAELVVMQDEMMITEPAQTVATETIPPTAAAPMAVQQKSAVKSPQTDRNRNIQKALANAGFYGGAIDGKIGPKTMNAIKEFQKTKGLKVDGRVGPKTWAELEKYLTR